jgi:hypothetical protein
MLASLQLGAKEAGFILNMLPESKIISSEGLVFKKKPQKELHAWRNM